MHQNGTECARMRQTASECARRDKIFQAGAEFASAPRLYYTDRKPYSLSYGHALTLILIHMIQGKGYFTSLGFPYCYTIYSLRF